MKISGVLLLALIGSISYSQNGDQTTINFLNEIYKMEVKSKMSPDSYGGSPYLPKDFEEGKLISNGREAPGFIRYNVLANQIELKVNQEDSTIITLPSNQFNSFIIDDVEYSWKNLETEDGWKNGFFIKYYEGDDLKFYGYPELFKKEAVKSLGFVEGKPAHYRVDIKYYLSRNNSEFNSIKIKNKDFKKSLNLDGKAKVYLDDHKLKKVSDVIKFLEWYEVN